MGIGLLELVVIAVAALVLLGPQKLPEVLKQLGKFYVQLRRTSNEFKSALDHVVRQAEEEARIDEIKRLTALARQETLAVQSSLDRVSTEAGLLSTQVLNPGPESHHVVTRDSLVSSGENHGAESVGASSQSPPLARSEFAVDVFREPQLESTEVGAQSGGVSSKNPGTQS
ncbi:MAG: twin-arginine translocase TatA/TatE family subunit [Proteobacteria bacterium]|nr:twin-arginine translocase TatA/TatE family subunit [Pseudomonadota bacterium]